MNTAYHAGERRTTARITGIWYLLIALSGMIGFMVLHPQIFVTDDPVATLANLKGKQNLAQIRVVMELLIVTSQALAAVWFYKLFKPFNDGAAWALGVWGIVNAVVIMVSAIAMGAMLSATSSSGIDNQQKLTVIFALGQIVSHAWSVGGIFFGLWLLPMGYVVIKYQCMPLWLGRILILGGIGYILMTFLHYAGVKGNWLQALVLPASIGEFWMVGYLLIYGLRPAK